MTNLPDPDHKEAQVQLNRLRQRISRNRKGLAVVVVCAMGLAGAGAWGWFFVHRQLSPLVADSLENALDRPIEVGPVEGVSLTSLRFGPSSLPATEDDLNQASVDAIEVGFNPLDVLLSRTLGLDLTLIDVDAYVEQNQGRQWFVLPDLPDEPGLLKIQVNSVRLRDSRLVVVPYADPDADADVDLEVEVETEADGDVDLDLRVEVETETQADAAATSEFERDNRAESDSDSETNSVESASETASADEPFQFVLEDINAETLFQDQGKLIRFELAAETPQEGLVDLSGDFLTLDRALNVIFQGQDLPITDVLQLAEQAQLLDIPAVEIQTGTLNSDVELQYRPDQPLNLNGNARFQNLSAQIAGLADPLTDGEGLLRFKGTTVTVEEAEVAYGPLKGEAEGQIDLETGYDIAAQIRPVDVNEVLDTFELDLPVPVEAILTADVDLTGPLAQPLITGTLESVQSVQVDQLNLSQIVAQFRLDPDELVVNDLQVLPLAGGEITGQGRLTFAENGGLVLDLQGRDLPADAIAATYTTLPVTLGRLAFDAQVFGPLTDLQAVLNWRLPDGTYPGRGEIAFAGGRTTLRNTVVQVGSGTVQADAVLAGRQWQALINGTDLPLDLVSPGFQGLVNGEFELAGTLDSFAPSAIQADGTFTVSQGLASVSSQLASLNQPLTATVRWNGEVLEIQEATSQDIVASGIVVPQLEGEGAPAISAIDLDIRANNVDLALVSQFVPSVQLAGQATFDGQITGTPTDPNLVGALQLNQLQVNDIPFDPVLQGTVRFDLAQGGQLNLAGEQDQIELALNSQFQPETFNVELYRLFGERTQIAGTTQNNRLKGSIENFPIGVLNLPPGGVANLGEINGRVRRAEFEFDLVRRDGMAKFVVDRPALGYIGADKLEGQIRYVNGVATLSEGRLFNGDSLYVLDGSFSPGSDPTFRSQINIQRGQVQDILQALQWFEISKLGSFEPFTYAQAADVVPFPVGDPNASLMDQLRRFAEIEALIAQTDAAKRAESPFPALENLDGPFTGNITLSGSLRTGISADFQILGQNWDWPYVTEAGGGRVSQEEIQDELRDELRDEFEDKAQREFQDGLEGESQPDRPSETDAPLRNQIVLAGDFKQGIVTLQPLRFESCEVPGTSGLLDGCKIREYDFGEDTTLDTDDPNKVLLTFTGQVGGTPQSGRLQARNIPVAFIEQFRPLPIALKGNVNASATLAGTLMEPELRGEVNLIGGSLEDQAIQSATGQFSYRNRRLNLRSAINVFGVEESEEESLPETAVETVSGDIAGDGTGDNVASDANPSEPEAETQPIGVTASLPIPLNLREEVRVDVNVRNDSLALLNVFNDQVRWEEGEGLVNLRVRGTVIQPVVQGLICLENAEFSSPKLADPLKQVNGAALFLSDRVLVNNLEGSFPGGQIQAQGVLPVFSPLDSTFNADPSESPEPETISLPSDLLPTLDPDGQCQFSNLAVDNPVIVEPLTVFLDEVDLRLTSLYEGEVDGNILIGGTALAPRIGGDLILSDGQVLIPDTNQAEAAAAPNIEEQPGFSVFNPALEDLTLTLDKNVQITKAPLLSFAATGALDVNGPFSDLEPRGIIRLRRGSVNLFTTQFVLEGGFRNIAEFGRPGLDPLDPYLQVRLRATVSETTGPRLDVSSPFPVSEVLENPFETAGGTQTVRVRAEVDGPASQLFQNLELTSTPSRGESEILGLIGGGAINTFTQGDGTLAIANLASNIFFGNFQNRIAALLGLSEFRVFPTTSSPGSSDGDADSSLGVGIEAGLNITSNLAVSALKVVTQDDPAQFGLRYQINDQLLFRGSSDFTEDTRAVVEYRINF